MVVYYFAYGANKDPAMIHAIIGRLPKGRPAYVEGYQLVVQSLDKLPVPAQEIILQSWDRSFKSYALQRGKGKVYGTLWEITSKERKHVRKWELSPWFTDEEVIAILETGEKVVAITEIIVGQGIDHVCDGKDYPAFIVDRSTILANAKKVRLEF
jgi:hypothetical protein